MRPWIQKFILFSYSTVQKTGVLNLRVSKDIFDSCYDFYKKHFEDPFYALTLKHPELFAKGDILDVGANVGYTAELFARAVTRGCHVHAFEPESENFKRMQARIVRHKLENIICLQEAVGAKSGEITVYKNPDHPADHRVYEARDLVKGETVPLRSLDEYCEDLGVQISFVKIDVQGYEPQVLEGMKKIISSNKSVSVAFEVHLPMLDEFGYSVEDLTSYFNKKDGFRLYLIENNGHLKPTTSTEIKKQAERRGYTDVLATRHAI